MVITLKMCHSLITDCEIWCKIALTWGKRGYDDKCIMGNWREISYILQIKTKYINKIKTKKNTSEYF